MIKKVGEMRMKEYIVQAITQETIDAFDAHNPQELIRCKDCQHYKDSFCYNQNSFDDEKICGNTSPDWYCADGKRR